MSSILPDWDRSPRTAEMTALSSADFDEETTSAPGLSLRREYVFVALGGAAGALARWTLGLVLPFEPTRAFTGFPFFELVVNLSGCLLAGVVVGALSTRASAPPWIRPLLFAGFCGGYTSVSTFSQFFAAMIAGNFMTTAVVYGGSTLIGSLVAVRAGMLAGEVGGRAEQRRRRRRRSRALERGFAAEHGDVDEAPEPDALPSGDRGGTR